MENKPPAPPDALTVLLMVSRQLENHCDRVFLLGSIDSLLFDKEPPYHIGVVHSTPLSAVPIDLQPALGLSRVDCVTEGSGEQFKILNAQGIVLVVVIECAYGKAKRQYRYQLHNWWTPWMQLLPVQVVSLEGAGFDVPAEWRACHVNRESVAAP